MVREEDGEKEVQEGAWGKRFWTIGGRGVRAMQMPPPMKRGEGL